MPEIDRLRRGFSTYQSLRDHYSTRICFCGLRPKEHSGKSVGESFSPHCVLAEAQGIRGKGQHQCLFFQGTPSVTYFLTRLHLLIARYARNSLMDHLLDDINTLVSQSFLNTTTSWELCFQHMSYKGPTSFLRHNNV